MWFVKPSENMQETIAAENLVCLAFPDSANAGNSFRGKFRKTWREPSIQKQDKIWEAFKKNHESKKNEFQRYNPIILNQLRSMTPWSSYGFLLNWNPMAF